MKKKVVCLFGGVSSEYSVSLQSAVSIIEHFPTQKFDLAKVGISKDGRWFLGDFNCMEIADDSWMNREDATEVTPGNRKNSSLIECMTQNPIKVDTVIHCIHGKYGEDGIIQALLEVSGIKYVGSGILSSAACYDKEITHRLMKVEDIRMADYEVIARHQIDQTEYQNIVEKLGLPMIIKPSREGSSYGVSVVRDYVQFNEGLRDAWKYDHKVLVEKFIKGIEIGCAIAMIKGELITGVCDEIELHTEFFDFDAKYKFKNASIHCPARIDDNFASQIQQLAKRIFIKMECQDLARIDFFLGQDSRIYLNEINTIPGLTSHSRFPSMMKQVGIGFTDLIEQMINNALGDSNDR